MSAPWLYVRISEQYGIALVQGNDADPVTKMLAPDTRRRSRTGRGWVIPSALVPDLEALAASRHEFIAVTRQRGAA